MSDYEFSRNGYLETNFRSMRNELYADDDQFVVLIVGDSNTGKTALSLFLDRFLNHGDVNLKTYAINHDRYIDEYRSRPRRKTIVYEEGRESFDNNKYSHSNTREAEDSLYEYRKYLHTVIINFQTADHLLPSLVQNLGDCMIHTPSKGAAHFFGKKSMRSMWSGRDFTGWDDPDFRDYFPDPEQEIPELWEAYEEKALDRLDESNDSELEDENLLMPSDMSDRLGVSVRTIQNWCDDGKLRFIRLPNGDRRIPESEVNSVVHDPVSPDAN